jgi:hypothetical protein
VQVAFDATAGLVGGGDDAGAGGGEFGVELGVVQGDRELAGDEGDRVEAVGGERGADEPVLQQQHRPQVAAAEDGHGQQGTAGEVGEVGVAGEAVVVGGVGNDKEFLGALDITQHRQRHHVFGPGAAHRYGVAAGCG